MKKMIRPFIAAGLLCAALTCSYAGEEPGYVDFGKLNPTGEGQFVDVNIKSNLIAMVAAFTKKSEPEVAEVIQGLKQIRVNVLGLTKENREELTSRIAAIREKLDNSGWERVATVIEKKQDVGVFLKMKDATTVEGLCVTVSDGKQVVLVNIVGDIRPDKLATVGERFNLEPLKHLPARPAKEKSENTRS